MYSSYQNKIKSLKILINPMVSFGTIIVTLDEKISDILDINISIYSQLTYNLFKINEVEFRKLLKIRFSEYYSLKLNFIFETDDNTKTEEEDTETEIIISTEDRLKMRGNLK